MNTINVENCKTLLIGRRGENDVTTVAFDFTEWQTEFGSGVVDLYVKRFGDESAYPVVLTIDGTVASWLVTETDTNVAGYGKAEYVYRVDGKIAKSAVFPFFVAEDIGQPASEPPDPYESWLEQLTALGAETEAHAQAAEQSAENAAESAEDATQSATSAEGYAGQAETAAGLAQAAQTASEAARDAAQTAQASAESSATAASGSAASAAGSATAAAGSASDASSSASAAGASATTASTAATQAEAAKTAAQTAQSAAEDAAEDAQQAAQQAHVEYEQLSGEVDDLSDEVSQQKSAIEDLQDLTNRKAGMLVDTASGAIASFVPDSTIDNLLGVTVDVEPQQDLHGYESPWPAGGGKNKLASNATKDVTVAGQQTIVVSLTKNVAEITIDRDLTTSIGYRFNDGSIEAVLPAGGYFFSSNITNQQPGSGLFIFDASTATILGRARAEGGAYISLSTETTVRLGFSLSAGTKAGVYWFQIEAGSTPTAYAPYENLCPISGWDAVEVGGTGINVWDEEWENGTFNTTTGVPISTGSALNQIRSRNLIPVKPSTTYYWKASSAVWAMYLDVDGNPIYPGRDGVHDTSNNSIQMGGNNPTYTTPSNAAWVKFYCQASYGNTYNHDISINYPTADHAYHPYAGNRYTIALGQTVYGGTLDVTNGTLTVDRAKYVLTGLEQWAAWGNAYYTTVLPALAINNASTVNCISDMLPGASTGELYAGSVGIGVRNSGIYIDSGSYNRLSELVGMSIVYNLASPTTIQLDPVTISAISGQTNNVWADAGDVAVEFAADLKAYIDSKISAAVAAMS